MPDIIAIGGGQASFSFVNKLRSLGCNKSITIICSENFLPYQRPPLSKKFLAGEFEKNRLLFRTKNFYNENKINTIIGQRVVKIDRKQNKIFLDSGRFLKYKILFLGLGSKPRLLKTDNKIISNIFYIRNIENVELFANEFQYKKKLLILGGGYIGLEVAAVARKMGIDVTIIETQKRILNRSTSKFVSNYLKKIHKQNGVYVKEDTSVKKFMIKGNKFFGVLTEENEEIIADFLLIGIGAEPNTKIASDAGLTINNGIRINEHCMTDDPRILAAGDCVSFKYNEEFIRLESVGNAIEQSEVAAENVFGIKRKYRPVPWFWSDQYDYKLQTAGLNTGFTNVFHRMDKNKNSFWYYKDNKFISVDAINDPISYMIGKKMLEMNKTPDPNEISSSNNDLKRILREMR